jgi:DNA helicase HerA-like ATPase
VGDLEKPKLVFFFDEAHLLFDDAPDALLDKIEQVTRLIRSKGVGIYFVTQNPLDVPDKVLGQLGNRVQHALRAFTERDQKAVRAAAETFRTNPAFDIEKAITELTVGEALVSPLDEHGAPCVVERAFVVPPRSQLGPITLEQRRAILGDSVLAGHYDETVDRESAYELLKAKAEAAAQASSTQGASAPRDSSGAQPQGRARSSGRPRESMVEAMEKSAMRAAGSAIGRQITRGILGSIFGSKKGRGLF